MKVQDTILIRKYDNTSESYDYIEFDTEKKLYAKGNTSIHLGHNYITININVNDIKELEKVELQLKSKQYKKITNFFELLEQNKNEQIINNLITSEKYHELLDDWENGEDIGNETYILLENEVYIGIDNTFGEVVVEEFKTLTEAKIYTHQAVSKEDMEKAVIEKIENEYKDFFSNIRTEDSTYLLKNHVKVTFNTETMHILTAEKFVPYIEKNILKAMLEYNENILNSLYWIWLKQDDFDISGDNLQYLLKKLYG